MDTHVCISTANQVVNLLPALQMRAERIVLISSQEAEHRHWTANLRWVCQKKKLPLTTISISRDEEMAPEKMTEALPKDLAGGKVVWNISGGKKSMTLGMLYSLGQLGGRVIYTENRPHRIVEYQGFRFLRETDMDYFLDLEDLLNLNGFSLFKGQGANQPLTSVAQDDWIVSFARYYRIHSMFQEMANRLFTSREPDIREKENLADAVRRTLQDHRPEFEKVIDTLQGFDENAAGKIRKAVARCQKDQKDLNISKILDACNDNYWNHLKKAMIPLLAERLLSPVSPLLDHSLKPAEVEDLTGILRECNGCLEDKSKGFRQGNVRLPQKPGICFEKAVAAEFLRVLDGNNLRRFIPHVKLNVETTALLYSSEGHVIDAEPKSTRADDEFDVVVVTPWGSLHIFDAKTHYGKGGDVLRSSRDSALTKGGIFGGITFIDPLLKSSKHPKTGDYPSYFQRDLIEKRSLIDRIGLRAWCFDEIENNLLKMLKSD